MYVDEEVTECFMSSDEDIAQCCGVTALVCR